ncbi:NAD(P)/FAD-dependent oxidoreductase [Roseivirga sp.]|uniref:NAD(P)/FAD-dependent oxidoreductase n=1 Tax=Roseivirga sp. TaxID=1964215 RepID=UPI003B5234FC
MSQKVAVIGGGAAGFFAAISCKEHFPESEVVIYEKTTKLLSKVKVSGGGRCNVTNACQGNGQFARHYPRGEKQLKKAFSQFSSIDTINWFEEKGVKLKAEADGRMFPITDDSQTIIDCLMHTARRLGVAIHLSEPVNTLQPVGDGIELTTAHGRFLFNKVIVTSGGSPKAEGFDWLKALGHEIVPPVPSLFTFNMPGNPITQLMGLSVPNASVRIQGTKLMQQGPLLITHWGMSGPAVLKTSAWGARILNELNYQFTAHMNWLGEMKDVELREVLHEAADSFPKKQMKNHCPFDIPQRLWEYLLKEAQIELERPWAELSKKHVNRLIELLTNHQHKVSGKTTFKEEFVTAGGIALSDVDFNTMESRVVSGLYFAGEVLNIDGVTGGFNFQAAWTTAHIAGKHCLA